MIVLELREEVISLEVEKRNAGEKLNELREGKKIKIMLLESKIDSLGKSYEERLRGKEELIRQMSSSSSLPTEYLRAKQSIDSLQTSQHMLKSKLDQSQFQIKSLQEQNSTLTKDKEALFHQVLSFSKNQKISPLLSPDSELISKLTHKLKSQKTEIRNLESYLRTAKAAYDKLITEKASAGEEEDKAKPVITIINPYRQHLQQMHQSEQIQALPHEYHSHTQLHEYPSPHQINPPQIPSSSIRHQPLPSLRSQGVSPIRAYQPPTPQPPLSPSMQNMGDDAVLLYDQWVRFDKSRFLYRIQQAQIKQHEFQNKYYDGLNVILQLKQEFLAKLTDIHNTNQHEIEKVMQENNNSLIFVDKLQNQIKYMENKELKLLSELDELKQIHTADISDYKTSLKESQIAQNTQAKTIEEMAAQIKNHEITLEERSEQMRIMLETIEKLESSDLNDGEVVQNCLNLTAELCSQKTLTAQSEKKITDFISKINNLNHTVSQLEKTKSELEREVKFGVAKLKTSGIERDLLRKRMEELERDKILLENEISEVSIELRRVNDSNMSNEEKVHLSKKQMHDAKIKAEQILQEERKQLKATISKLNDELASRQSLAHHSQLLSSERDHSSQLMDQLMDKEKLTQLTSHQTHKHNKSTKFLIEVKKLELLLLEFLKKSSSPEPSEIKIQTLFSEICTILIEENKTIGDLHKQINQLQQKLDQVEGWKNYENAYNALSSDYEIMQEASEIQKRTLTDLTNLKEVSDEKRIHKLQAENEILNSSLRSTTLSLLKTQEKMHSLQAETQSLSSKLSTAESQQHVQSLHTQSQVSLLSSQIESQMYDKLSIRNEQIRTYFDTHLTKLLLGDNSNKAISLTREICSLKLQQNRLEQTLSSISSQNSSLQLQNTALNSLIEKCHIEIAELSNSESQNMKEQCNQFLMVIQKLHSEEEQEENSVKKENQLSQGLIEKGFEDRIIDASLVKAELNKKAKELFDLNSKLSILQQNNDALNLKIQMLQKQLQTMEKGKSNYTECGIKYCS